MGRKLETSSASSLPDEVLRPCPDKIEAAIINYVLQRLPLWIESIYMADIPVLIFQDMNAPAGALHTNSPVCDLPLA